MTSSLSLILIILFTVTVCTVVISYILCCLGSVHSVILVTFITLIVFLCDSSHWKRAFELIFGASCDICHCAANYYSQKYILLAKYTNIIQFNDIQSPKMHLVKHHNFYSNFYPVILKL